MLHADEVWELSSGSGLWAPLDMCYRLPFWRQGCGAIDEEDGLGVYRLRGRPRSVRAGLCT